MFSRAVAYVPRGPPNRRPRLRSTYTTERYYLLLIGPLQCLAPGLPRFDSVPGFVDWTKSQSDQLLQCYSFCCACSSPCPRNPRAPTVVPRTGSAHETTRACVNTPILGPIVLFGSVQTVPPGRITPQQWMKPTPWRNVPTWAFAIERRARANAVVDLWAARANSRGARVE